MNRKLLTTGLALLSGTLCVLMALLVQANITPTAQAMILAPLPRAQTAVSNVAASAATRMAGLSPRSVSAATGYTWSPLGGGMNDDVNAIAISDNGDVYAGGDFTQAGTCTSAAGCNHIAKWDPATDTWLPLGTGMDDSVYALAISGNTLYAGGKFTQAGTCTSADGCNAIAKWDTATQTWSSVGLGVGVGNGEVYALAVDSSGGVYAGGDFQRIRNYTGNCILNSYPLEYCYYIARWDTSTNTWSGLGQYPLHYSVYAIAIKGNNVYVGENGDLISCGSGKASTILEWDGSTWSPLGCYQGVGAFVDALAFGAHGELYVGGIGMQPGNCTSGCYYIAKWDGLTWSPLGGGLSSVSSEWGTMALAVNSSGDVYAGGDFDSAGTCTTGCRHIAKWDGSTWSSLDTGMTGLGDHIGALAIHGSYLYAGGDFVGAGTCTYSEGCHHIARYALSSSAYPIYLPLIVR
jgi:hypothetical protein